MGFRVLGIWWVKGIIWVKGFWIGWVWVKRLSVFRNGLKRVKVSGL